MGTPRLVKASCMRLMMGMSASIPWLPLDAMMTGGGAAGGAGIKGGVCPVVAPLLRGLSSGRGSVGAGLLCLSLAPSESDAGLVSHLHFAFLLLFFFLTVRVTSRTKR